MNTKQKKLILSILLLKEEYSDKDFAFAVQFFNKFNFPIRTDAVLNFLCKESQIKNKIKNSNGVLAEDLDKFYSQIGDSEKVNLLKETTNYIMNDNIFGDTAELKRFFSKFNKNIATIKSKPSTIRDIVKYLSTLPIVEIRTVLADIEKYSRTKNNDPYLSLSKYIIDQR